MRHCKSGYKLGRTASHRRAMLRNMVTSLFEHERITTTEVKAKALKPLAEKMITLAKRGDLHSRRQALSILTKKDVTHKLFSEIKDRYMERAGGYVSIVRVGVRHGDCAEMAVMQLIKPEDRTKTSKKKSRKKKDSRTAAASSKEAKKEIAPKPKAPDAEPKPEEVKVEAEGDTVAQEKASNENVEPQTASKPDAPKDVADVAPVTDESEKTEG